MAELGDVQPAVIPAEIPTASVAAPVSAQPETPTVPAGGDPSVAAVAPGADASPVAPAPGAEPPSADAVPAREPTLLEKFDAEQKVETEAPKPEDPKADEPKVEAEPAKVEEPAAVEPVTLEPIQYFDAETGIKLPETLTLDDATREKTAAAFDTFRTDPIKGAQALVDLYNEQMAAYAAHTTAEQFRVFNETRKGWQTEVMADPVLGGPGYQTSMGVIARARDALISDAKPGSERYLADKARMDEFLAVTGAGDHPWFLGMLHRAGRRYIDEPGMPPPNPKPPKDIGKSGGPSKLYDHPSSQATR